APAPAAAAPSPQPRARNDERERGARPNEPARRREGRGRDDHTPVSAAEGTREGIPAPLRAPQRHADFITWQPPEEEGDDEPILGDVHPTAGTSPGRPSPSPTPAAGAQASPRPHAAAHTSSLGQRRTERRPPAPPGREAEPSPPLGEGDFAEVF